MAFSDAHTPRHFPLCQATALKFPAKPLSCWHESRVSHALNVVKFPADRDGKLIREDLGRAGVDNQKEAPANDTGALTRA